MESKRILIIAAGFLQTFLIKRAKELGFYVIAIDGNPNAEGFKYADESACVNITDPEACIDFAKNKNINGVVTAASDYGVISASEVAAALNLPGIRPDAARTIKNKFQVRKRLYENRVDDTGESFEISSTRDLEALYSSLNFPVMVKPVDGSGSRGASRVDEWKSLKTACEFAMAGSLSKKAVIEPFISGKEFGVESFVLKGETHILAIMDKKMTDPPYYAELGHAIPSGLDANLENKIRSVVKNALKALEVNFGSVNMDILVTASGNVHIVDIGARMGGNLIGSHIVPLATGIDYMGNILRASVGEEVDFSPKYCNSVATNLLALSPGKIKSLEKIEKMEDREDFILEHHLHVGDTINEYHTNLDGMGYVVAVEKDVNIAKKCAEDAKKLIDRSIVREE